jgi:hypothetical protein
MFRFAGPFEQQFLGLRLEPLEKVEIIIGDPKQ